MIYSLSTILIYFFSRTVTKKFKFNPILLSILIIIGLLLLFKIDYTPYKEATSWISWLLGPVVVMLAIPLYKNKDELVKNFLPIVTGIFTSLVVSAGSVLGLSFLFKFSKEMINSLLPKSITTPMAIEVTQMIDGVSGLTIVFVILTGVIGASLAEITLKLFSVNHPLAKGIGIGASSHGIGTSKAVELGEEEAASSGLAMGLTGVSTVILYSLLTSIFH